METKYITEEEQIVMIWEPTGMLNGVDDRHVTNMALCLENQRLYNAYMDSWSQGLDGYYHPMWKRISIPIIRRLYGTLKSHEKFDVRSNVCGDSAKVKRLGLRGHWSPSLEERGPKRTQHSLDKEAKYTIRLVEQLRQSIDWFIEDTMEETNALTFYVVCLGLDDNGEIVLYYDLG